MIIDWPDWMMLKVYLMTEDYEYLLTERGENLISER